MQQLAGAINAGEARAKDEGEYLDILQDRIGQLEDVLGEHGLLDEDGEPIEAEDQGHPVEVDQAGKPESPDTRDRAIIAMHQAGESKRGIARALGISDGTVRNVLKRRQAEAA